MISKKDIDDFSSILSVIRNQSIGLDRIITSAHIDPNVTVFLNRIKKLVLQSKDLNIELGRQLSLLKNEINNSEIRENYRNRSKTRSR